MTKRRQLVTDARPARELVSELVTLALSPFTPRRRVRVLDVPDDADAGDLARAHLRAGYPSSRVVVEDRRELALDSVTCDAQILGGLAPWPLTHRIRAIITHEGSLTLDWPLAGIDRARPFRVLAERGRVVLFDVDRDPVAVSSEGIWRGETLDLTVSTGPAIAPASRPADPGAPLTLPRAAATAIVRRASAGSLLFVLAFAGTSFALELPALGVLAVSYIHYLVYLATLHARRELAFAELVRDALFWKTLSMTCLAVAFATTSSWALAPMVVAAVGVSGSTWAATLLGLERTYFGVELGVVPYERVEGGPYRVLPHPMISLAVVALIGLYLDPGFRAAWPWLVPGHVALYLLHLAQEIFGEARVSRSD